jgi:hypothetical protein
MSYYAEDHAKKLARGLQIGFVTKAGVKKDAYHQTMENASKKVTIMTGLFP